MPLSTTQYGYIIDPLVPLTDDTGRTISNGYVRVFMAGTSTPVITYKNFDGATNEETVQLDNSGRTAYPVIGSKGSTYKVCVYDAEHSQETAIKTIDKVVPTGASVSATNIVTGLDNVESPEAGWLKSTVSGTDAEVSLDATNVTSEVDTMVKATAASEDYMMPLVHKTGSDPDKKITLGNIFKFVLNFIHSLTDTATESDIASGNYFALDGSAGTKKLNSTTLLTKTAQNALAGNVAPAFDPERTSGTAYKVGEDVIYNGKRYIFKNPHYGAWSSSDVQEIPIDKDNLVVFPYRVFSGGYVLDSLNNALDNRVYVIQRASLTTTDFPADAPSDANFIFVSLKVNSSSSQYQREQRLLELDNNKCWVRQYNTIGGSWKGWSLSYKALDVSTNQIFAGWSKNPASLDDVAENSVLHLTVNSSTATTNIPSDFLVGSATDGTLFTFKCFYSASNYRIYQTLIRESDGMIWTRYWQSSWKAWVAKTEKNYILLEENEIFHTSDTNPASLKDLVTTQVVRVWRDSSVVTTEFPSDYPIEGKGTLSVYKVYSTKSSNTYQVFQILTLDTSSVYWTRMYNSIGNTWSDWAKTKSKYTFFIGQGQQYTTLKAGIAAAYEYEDAEVVIMPGTYDCVTEWSTELHAVTESTSEFGNPVGNGMHIVAMPGVKIKALIEREDFLDLTDAQFARIRTVFNVFRARSGSFTVENLDIESKHTRYCFHDDSGTLTPSVRKFLNCRMLRHTDNASAVHNPLVACIGGGLSQKETVIIEGGWYKSEPSDGNLDIMNGDVNYAQVPISYHHNSGSDCEASITIKNVYLADKGFFGFYYYGTTAEKCKVLISGCRSKYPPLLCRCTTDSAVVNFDVIPFCNEFDEAENGHWETDDSGPLNSTWVPDA